MTGKNRAIRISKIVIILLVIGTIIPAASAVFDNYPPCCPNYEDYPYYYYPVDPYYMFPVYCSCPFLDDALNRSIWKNTPAIYWEWVIESQSGSSSCSTCGGSSTTSSISYSNTNVVFPEKDALMEGYDKISVSTAFKTKDQVLARNLR